MLLLICFTFFSDIALAGDVCEDSVGWKLWVAIVWASLKPLSWALGCIADKTENKWDNYVAKFVSKSVSYLGWVIGLMGIGNVPESVKHRPKVPFS